MLGIQFRSGTFQATMLSACTISAASLSEIMQIMVNLFIKIIFECLFVQKPQISV